MSKLKPTDFQPGEEVIATYVVGIPELIYGKHYHVGDNVSYWDQTSITLKEFPHYMTYESHRFERAKIEEPVKKKVLRFQDGMSLQSVAQKMSVRSTEVLMKLLATNKLNVHINSILNLEDVTYLAQEFGWELESDHPIDNPPFQVDDEAWRGMVAEQAKKPNPPIDVKSFVEAGRASGDSLSIQASEADLNSIHNLDLGVMADHRKETEEVELLVIPGNGLKVKEACGFKTEAHAVDYASHQDSICIIYKSIMKVVPAKITKME